MKICVYPGSFDPFTVGHLDVLMNAVSLFDKVYVSVLNNTAKSASFSVEERVRMIQNVIDDKGLSNVCASSFEGLLVAYARSVGAGYIIRGLRAITDFEYEFQIDAINSHLAADIRTMYFMASPSHSFLSSSTIKEIGFYSGKIKGLVPSCNLEFIAERLAKK